MNNTLNNNPNNFNSWQEAVKNIYGVLHNLGGSSTLEVNDNLVLEGTTNASTSQAIYGVNVITTSTTSDLATRLPDAKTGRQVVFINNSSLFLMMVELMFFIVQIIHFQVRGRGIHQL